MDPPAPRATAGRDGDPTALLDAIHEEKSAAAAERVYRTLSVLFRSAYQLALGARFGEIAGLTPSDIDCGGD